LKEKTQYNFDAGRILSEEDKTVLALQTDFSNSLSIGQYRDQYSFI
jgi:hypothetical protein